MTSFWGSIDKLSVEAWKVTWFGVGVACFGLIFTEFKWISWFGLFATVVGLVLKHRSEFLKKIEAAPRMFTPEQKAKVLAGLEKVPRQPVAVLFFGQDLEAKAFAAEIKNLLETAQFSIGSLQGFIVFEVSYGLSMTIYNSDSSNPTALGIQKVFASAGLDLKTEVTANKMNPTVQISVHSKAPR